MNAPTLPNEQPVTVKDLFQGDRWDAVSLPGFELPSLLPVFLGGEMSQDSGAAESRQLNFNEYDDDYYADNGGGGGGGDYGDYGAQRRQQRMRQRKQLAQRRSLLARRQLAVQKDRTNLA